MWKDIWRLAMSETLLLVRLHLSIIFFVINNYVISIINGIKIMSTLEGRDTKIVYNTNIYMWV